MFNIMFIISKKTFLRRVSNRDVPISTTYQ